MKKQIRNWKPSNKFYLEEIDKSLTYHLYLRYLDHTEEVYRETIDGKATYKYYKFFYCSLGGWYPQKKTWFSKDKEMNSWYDFCFKHRPYVQIDRHFYNKMQLVKALPQLKYVWPDYEDKWRLYDFIKVLKEHPEMEMVYKNEKLKRLWDNMMLYRLSKAKKKQLLKYVATCKNNWCSQLNEFLYCMNAEVKDRTYKKYQEYLEINSYKKISKDINVNYVMKRYNKQITELGKSKFIMLYKEYLRMAKKLNINNLYPRNIEKAHDEVTNSLALTEKKTPLLKEKTYKNYVSKVIKHKEIELVIPKITGDLIVLGNKLKNCVGTYGYDEKMIKGESLIVEVRHDNEPVECCEIDLKKKKIEQLYGYENSSDGKYHFIAQRLINKYIRSL